MPHAVVELALKEGAPPLLPLVLPLVAFSIASSMLRSWILEDGSTPELASNKLSITRAWPTFEVEYTYLKGDVSFSLVV